MVGAVHVVFCSPPGVEENPARRTLGGCSAWSKVGWALVRQVLVQCAHRRSLNMLPSSFCILRTKALSDSQECCESIVRSGALYILGPSFFLGS
eukprot:2514245-Pyramimonas_sp.AAC.1